MIMFDWARNVTLPVLSCGVKFDTMSMVAYIIYIRIIAYHCHLVRHGLIKETSPTRVCKTVNEYCGRSGLVTLGVTIRCSTNLDLR